MSGDEVRDLWAAIDALRVTVAALTVTVGRVEELVKGMDRLLSDRCTASHKTIEKIIDQQARNMERLADLDKKFDGRGKWMAGAAAVGAFMFGMLQWLLHWMKQ